MAKILENPKPVFTLPEQVQCLRREITMRGAVYPGRVAAGKMSQADMDREIATMEAAADSIERMAKNGLFRQTWNAMADARLMPLPELVAEIALAQVQANKLLVAGKRDKARTTLIRLTGLTLALAEVLGALETELALHSPSTTAAATDGPATVEQKKAILKLLNHPAIEHREKTKVMLNINRLSVDKAADTILDLNATIDAYDGPTTYAKAS